MANGVTRQVGRECEAALLQRRFLFLSPAEQALFQVFLANEGKRDASEKGETSTIGEGAVLSYFLHQPPMERHL